MMKCRDKVLILSCKEDSHVDLIIRAAIERGLSHRVVRLNTEDFPGGCKASHSEHGFSLHVRDSGRTVHSSEITTVWYRRPQPITVPDYGDEGIARFAFQQANALLRGLYFTCHDTARWVNPLPALHRARIKMQQLVAARDAGFKVPRTLASNDADELIAFAQNVGNVCTKSLNQPSFEKDGVGHALFTRRVRDIGELLEAAHGVPQCPVLLQEYVEKACDIRVVIIGEQAFAFEIESQAHPDALEDVRGVSPEHLPHRCHQLTPEVAAAIRAFVRQQGLSFSSMDLVVGKRGEYWFIENNPNGQWLWLESLTGFDLTGPFLALLFGSCCGGGAAM